MGYQGQAIDQHEEPLVHEEASPVAEMREKKLVQTGEEGKRSTHHQGNEMGKPTGTQPH